MEDQNIIHSLPLINSQWPKLTQFCNKFPTLVHGLVQIVGTLVGHIWLVNKKCVHKIRIFSQSKPKITYFMNKGQ